MPSQDIRGGVVRIIYEREKVGHAFNFKSSTLVALTHSQPPAKQLLPQELLDPGGIFTVNSFCDLNGFAIQLVRR